MTKSARIAVAVALLLGPCQVKGGRTKRRWHYRQRQSEDPGPIARTLDLARQLERADQEKDRKKITVLSHKIIHASPFPPRRRCAAFRCGL